MLEVTGTDTAEEEPANQVNDVLKWVSLSNAMLLALFLHLSLGMT